MKNNDWKERLGMVYSTNPDFQFDTGEEDKQRPFPRTNNACVSGWRRTDAEERP